MFSENIPVIALGLVNTICLCISAAVVGLFFGHVVFFLRLSNRLVFSFIARIYVGFMRGTPALVQLFILYFSLPLLGLEAGPMLAAIMMLGMNSGAYISEILRANILVVPIGQREAALAIGLSPIRSWIRIYFPQIWRSSLAGFVNEFSILLKSTPLASVIGVTELVFTGQMVSARTFQQEEVLMVIAISYLIITLPVNILLKRLELNCSGLGVGVNSIVGGAR